MQHRTTKLTKRHFIITISLLAYFISSYFTFHIFSQSLKKTTNKGKQNYFAIRDHETFPITVKAEDHPSPLHKVATITNSVTDHNDYSIDYIRSKNDDNVTSLPYHHHTQIIPLNNLTGDFSRFSQLKPGPIRPDFLEDAKVLRRQLRSNYAPSSSCPSVTLKMLSGVVPLFPGKLCYGLGSTILFYNNMLSNLTLESGTIVSDIDQMSCGWFRRDTTRSCKTMFGDCYFQALRGEETMPSNNYNNTCHKASWFVEKWGVEAYSSVHLTWLLRVNQKYTNISQQQYASTKSTSLTPMSDPQTYNGPFSPSSCIALHIRRGDTCHIRHMRACTSYGDYYQAIKIVLEQNPKSFERLVVMTDAPDFPLLQFQKLIPNITFSNEIDREKYQLQHEVLKKLRKTQSRPLIFPENRDLGNATTEFIDEWSLGSECGAVIGTFSASISCLLFQNMLARQGRVPVFVSLQSCLQQVNALQVNDDGCEASFFKERSEYRILPV